MKEQTASPRSKFLARFSDKELAAEVWTLMKWINREGLAIAELETKSLSRDVIFYNELVDRIKIAESIANRRDPQLERLIQRVNELEKKLK